MLAAVPALVLRLRGVLVALGFRDCRSHPGYPVVAAAAEPQTRGAGKQLSAGPGLGFLGEQREGVERGRQRQSGLGGRALCPVVLVPARWLRQGSVVRQAVG